MTATERRRKPELFLWEGHVDLGEGKREGGKEGGKEERWTKAVYQTEWRQQLL